MGAAALVSSALGAGAAVAAAPVVAPTLANVAVCLFFLLLGLLVSTGARVESAGAAGAEGGTARNDGKHPPTRHPFLSLPPPAPPPQIPGAVGHGRRVCVACGAGVSGKRGREASAGAGN